MTFPAFIMRTARAGGLWKSRGYIEYSDKQKCNR